MKIGKDDPILIIGASLSGITTAVALRHYGFQEVHLYEKQAQTAKGGGVLHLGANAMNSLKSLQLAERVYLAGGPWNTYKLRWKSGRVLGEKSFEEVKQDTSFLPVSVSQEAYLAEFMSLIPDEYIHLGKEFISFTARDKQLEAHFAGGETEQGSVLIGADGANSRVHLQLMGEQQRKAIKRIRYQAIVSEAQSGNLAELPKGESQEIIGPGKGFFLSHLKEQAWVCEISLEGNIPLPESVRRDTFKKAFKKWPAPVEILMDNIDPSAWHPYPVINQKIPKKWYNERVVLTGDAIHPITPHWHVGADLSVESAILLARLLAEEGNLKRAFRQFERKRVSRVKGFQKAALSRGPVMYAKSPLAWVFRNWLFPGLPISRGFTGLMKLNKGDYYEGK
ncbi:MAG: FAD-dependent monooxygenase [Bacteroidota bacterium]